MANNRHSVRIANEISHQFLTSFEIKRLRYHCKDHGIMDTVNSLDKLLAVAPDAKVKLVFAPDTFVINTIFIVTTEMATMCQRFPSILFFFRVFSFSNDYELFCFLCADDFGQCKCGAYILVRKGTSNILRFASASLVQSIPDIKRQVKCVIVGVDVEDKLSAKEIFPVAVVRLLHSQVLQTLLKDALDIGVKDDDQMLLYLFSRIATSKTPEDYNHAVRRLSLYCTEGFVKYFMGQWHICRDMWVDIWGFNFGSADPSEIVLQQKQKIIYLLDSNASMAQFILNLTSTSFIYKSLKTGVIASQYKSVCTTDAASMIEEELGIIEDCQYIIKHTSTGFTIEDGVSEFFMDPDLLTCSCTIQTSSLLPCRHIFATRLENGKELFDLKLLPIKKELYKV